MKLNMNIYTNNLIINNDITNTHFHNPYFYPPMYYYVAMICPLPPVFPPYVTCQLYIFRHNCYMLCMYCTQIGVFKQANQVGLTCLLQAPHCIHCKSQAKMHFICKFTY